MTQFNSYLTEEVVEDYSDGIIGRREALRRLGMLGVAAAVAVPMLAACDTAGVGGGAQTATGSPAASDPAGPPAQPTNRSRSTVLTTARCRVRGPRPRSLVVRCWSCTKTVASPITSVQWLGVSRRAVTRRSPLTCSLRRAARRPSGVRRRSPA